MCILSGIRVSTQTPFCESSNSLVPSTSTLDGLISKVAINLSAGLFNPTALGDIWVVEGYLGGSLGLGDGEYLGYGG